MPVRGSSSGTSLVSISPRRRGTRASDSGSADSQQKLQPVSQRLVRGGDRRVRGAVEHERYRGRRPRVRVRVPAGSCPRRLRRRAAPVRPRLPRPARAAHGARSARAHARRTETAEAGTSAPGSTTAAEGGRSRGRSSAASWARICRSSCLNAAPGSSPELVQCRPRISVGRERLGLPARAVQREHQQPAEALAVRMLRYQRLQLADQLRLAPERQVRLDPLLQRRQPADPPDAPPPQARTTRVESRPAPSRAKAPAPDQAAPPTPARDHRPPLRRPRGPGPRNGRASSSPASMRNE